MIFLGFVDISQKSIVLALLAAATSFWQMHLAAPNTKSNLNTNSKPDLSEMMGKQMKYTMPLVVFFISWKISAIVALYWFVSNLVGIAQDVYTRKQMKKI